MAWQQVRCTEREFEQNIFATQQHRSVLEHMADCTFCLILPGNSQSSQRLTEAFLAGCIPVFIGPPWHSLPLTQKVPLPLRHLPCPSGGRHGGSGLPGMAHILNRYAEQPEWLGD